MEAPSIPHWLRLLSETELSWAKAAGVSTPSGCGRKPVGHEPGTAEAGVGVSEALARGRGRLHRKGPSMRLEVARPPTAPPRAQGPPDGALRALPSVCPEGGRCFRVRPRGRGCRQVIQALGRTPLTDPGSPSTSERCVLVPGLWAAVLSAPGGVGRVSWVIRPALLDRHRPSRMSLSCHRAITTVIIILQWLSLP